MKYTAAYGAAARGSNRSRLPLKPNTHRRHRRDETVELRRVGGVYMNSQLTHDDDDGFGDVNAADGRDRVYIFCS